MYENNFKTTYACVCSYTCGCTCTCCTHACRGQRPMSRKTSLCTPPDFLRLVLSLNPELNGVAREASQLSSGNLPVSTSLVLGLQLHATIPSILYEF